MTAGDPIPVLVLFGPTASGKTALAERLFADSEGSFGCFRGRAEIVSADSMQVYRGMDIGTAKPPAQFLEKLPHHLISIRDPREQFCAGDFVRLADEACADIHARGKLPVMLGGTAFYLKNFIYGLPVTPQADPATRAELQQRLRAEGAEALLRELAEVDPPSAARISVHDEYRILRALEVFRSSGQPLSSFALSLAPRPGYRFLVISLVRGREDLNERIDRRVEEMVASGLPAEVAALRTAGYQASDPGMRAIGYREFFSADPDGTLGETALAGIVRQIQTDSRKYARRQETFIRSMGGVRCIRADDADAVYAAACELFGDSGGT